MKARSWILVGVIAGIVLGNTEQGRSLYRQAGERVSRFWRDPRVQARVDEVQDGVARIPVVGGEIVDLIDARRPNSTRSDSQSAS